jgi:hypothetical protein
MKWEDNHQNHWDTANAVLRGNCIALSNFLNKNKYKPSPKVEDGKNKEETRN